MSAGRSTTAPGTLWTHIAGRRTMRWNTADRRRKSFWSARNGPPACGWLPPCRRHCLIPLQPRPAVSGPTTSPVSTSRKLPGWRAYTAARSALPSGGACGICAAAMTAFSRQNEGGPMQTINLKQYYPFCTEDTLVEVSDEIAEAFLLDKRAEAARERKMYRYKAFYSLDCNDGIENAAIGWAQPSPEDCLMEKEAQAEYAELLRRLYEAISSLTPTQARRVHARYMLGMKVKDIAAMEGITPSQAGKSIHAALRRLRRYFIRRKWTSGL